MCFLCAQPEGEVSSLKDVKKHVNTLMQPKDYGTGWESESWVLIKFQTPSVMMNDTLTCSNKPSKYKHKGEH